jgi:hypothetical protein
MTKRNVKLSGKARQAIREQRAHYGARGRIAVIVSLVPRPDGKFRVVLDDARPVGEGCWAENGTFTFRDYSPDGFLETDLDRGEFESIGISLLSRLARQSKLTEG